MLKKITWPKLNIFDVFFITIILIVVGAFLWLRITKKTEWINVRIIVANDDWWGEAQPPQFWYVDNLAVGQSAYSSFGEKIAELINVDVFDIGGFRRRAFIDIKLKSMFDTKRNLYLYGFQPLQIGKPLDLTFGKYNVHGLIMYISGDETQYRRKRIEVRLDKVTPWVADSYQVGMEMRDSLNRVLARIDSVDIRPFADYVFSDIRGQRISVTDPDFREAILTLTIKTFSSGGNDYFVDRAAIKIGEKIWLQFPQTVIRDAAITKILE